MRDGSREELRTTTSPVDRGGVPLYLNARLPIIGLTTQLAQHIHINLTGATAVKVVDKLQLLLKYSPLPPVALVESVNGEQNAAHRNANTIILSPSVNRQLRASVQERLDARNMSDVWQNADQETKTCLEN